MITADPPMMISKACHERHPRMRLVFSRPDLRSPPNGKIDPLGSVDLQDTVARRLGEVLEEAQRYTKFFQVLGADRRCHTETLARALVAGRRPRRITPVVDATLVAELETGVLMGVHDLDQLDGISLLDIVRPPEKLDHISGRPVALREADLVLRDAARIWASYTAGPDRHTLVTARTTRPIVFAFMYPNMQLQIAVRAVERALDLMGAPMTRIEEARVQPLSMGATASLVRSTDASDGVVLKERGSRYVPGHAQE